MSGVSCEGGAGPALAYPPSPAARPVASLRPVASAAAGLAAGPAPRARALLTPALSAPPVWSALAARSAPPRRRVAPMTAAPAAMAVPSRSGTVHAPVWPVVVRSPPRAAALRRASGVTVARPAPGVAVPRGRPGDWVWVVSSPRAARRIGRTRHGQLDAVTGGGPAARADRAAATARSSRSWRTPRTSASHRHQYADGTRSSRSHRDTSCRLTVARPAAVHSSCARRRWDHARARRCRRSIEPSPSVPAVRSRPSGSGGRPAPGPPPCAAGPGRLEPRAVPSAPGRGDLSEPGRRSGRSPSAGCDRALMAPLRLEVDCRRDPQCASRTSADPAGAPPF